MALANGVLVHGPTAWACAVRTPAGEIAVARGRKPRLRVQRPFLRGPARLLEALLVLPAIKRQLPQARFAFERADVIAAFALAAAAARLLRRSSVAPGARELLASAGGVVPALVALRGGELAAYHGAEHVAIGRYESGEEATKEHARCGSHLLGPLLVASALAAAVAEQAPRSIRRPAGMAASLAALGAATEVFAWMERHPDHPLARALRWPGYALQRHVATADPRPEQVAVAEAALWACLDLETAA